MVNQFGQHPAKTRVSVLVFIKGSAAPIVMYVESPVTVYEELKKLVDSGQNKLYEKECFGPIKKVSLFTGQIAALAMQEEPYM